MGDHRSSENGQFIHEFSAETEQKMDELAEQGNALFDLGRTDEALKVWTEGLDLIPEPKNCYAQSVWFLASIGDIWFDRKNFPKALECFEAARTNLSGQGMNNPFVLLRAGQCYYETGDEDMAAELLLSAYMLEGEEIFEEDDEKYFDFLSSREEL